MRICLSLLLLAALVCGCASSPSAPPSFEDMERPTPPKELQRLERLVGTWDGEARMIMPEGMEAPPPMRGQGRTSWALGGMYLRSEGWHEIGKGERSNYVEFMSWDPKKKKYHSWYFSDMGEWGEGWATFSEDGMTLKFESVGAGPDGSPSKGKGTMTFIDSNLTEWTWTEKGGMGEMKLEGTSRRRR